MVGTEDGTERKYRWARDGLSPDIVANVSVHQYLQEDGNGQYRSFRVRDLAPASGEPVDLLLVVESPVDDG